MAASRAVDAVVAVVFTLGSWVWAVGEPGHGARSSDGWAFLLAGAVNLPLAARRRNPFPVALHTGWCDL